MNHHLYTNCEISASSVEKIVETKTEFVGKTFVRYYKVVWKSQWVREALLERCCGQLISGFWKSKGTSTDENQFTASKEVPVTNIYKLPLVSQINHATIHLPFTQGILNEATPMPSSSLSSGTDNTGLANVLKTNSDKNIRENARLEKKRLDKKTMKTTSVTSEDVNMEMPPLRPCGDHTYLKQYMLNNGSNMSHFVTLANKAKMPRQLVENSDDLLNYANLISQNNFLIPTERGNKRKNVNPNKKVAAEFPSREANTRKLHESATLQNSEVEKESNAVDGIEIKREEEDGEEIEDEHASFEEFISSDEEEDDPDDEDFNPSDESPDENDFEMTSSDEDKKSQPPRKKKAKPRRYAGPMLKCQECGKEHMEQPCPRCPRLKTCKVCGYRYAIKCVKCAYKCKFCGMACMRSSRLKEHIDAMHKRLQKYKCPICEKRFRHNLWSHMETHKEVADLICDICSKAFKHKKTLSRHMRIHSDARYKCEVCGRKFIEKDVLKTHSLLHTTGPKRFKCGVCAKDFHHKISLKEHIRRHHKDADQAELLIDTWKKDPERMGEVTENESDKESEDSLDEDEEENGQQRESMVSYSLAAATAGSLLYDNQSSSTYSLRSNSIHNRKQSEESFNQDPLINVTQQDMTECDNLESDVKNELQVTTSNTLEVLGYS